MNRASFAVIVALPTILAVSGTAALAAAVSAPRPAADRRAADVARADAACGAFQLVGFTEAETLPNLGVFGLTRLCASQFPGSRMCTLSEALGTVTPPVAATYVPAAWVRDEAKTRQPVAVKSPSEPGDDDGDEAPAAAAPENDQCLGWAATRGFATTVSSDGAVAVRPCGEAAPVACCAPLR